MAGNDRMERMGDDLVHINSNLPVLADAQVHRFIRAVESGKLIEFPAAAAVGRFQ